MDQQPKHPGVVGVSGFENGKTVSKTGSLASSESDPKAGSRIGDLDIFAGSCSVGLRYLDLVCDLIL